jgi:hypothetical protein
VNDHRPARRVAALFACVFAPFFAIPLLLDPYRWARAFGWRREPETDEGLYFGLLERRQPPVEHAEIVGYSAAAIAARRFKPR